MAETVLAVAAAAWGVLMGISPALQIRRMLRERSSRDLSVGYFLVLLVGFLLWICYGIVAANPVLIAGEQHQLRGRSRDRDRRPPASTRAFFGSLTRALLTRLAAEHGAY